MKFQVDLVQPRVVRIGAQFEPEEHWTAILGLRDEHVGSVDLWVKANNMGRRTSYDMWRLNSPSDVTAFMLYWHLRPYDG